MRSILSKFNLLRTYRGGDVLSRTQAMSLSNKCPFPAFLFGALTASSLYYLYSQYTQQQQQQQHKEKSSLRTLLPIPQFSSPHPYEQELKIALECVHEAGYQLNLALQNEKLIHSKGRANDFVTETDQKNEEIIFQKLRKYFPSHKFIGEVCSHFTFFLSTTSSSLSVD